MTPRKIAARRCRCFGQRMVRLCVRPPRNETLSKKGCASAKWAIIRERDTWARKHLAAGQKADGHHAVLFFLHLQNERSRLLPPGSGHGVWQTVHGWLLHVCKLRRKSAERQTRFGADLVVGLELLHLTWCPCMKAVGCVPHWLCIPHGIARIRSGLRSTAHDGCSQLPACPRGDRTTSGRHLGARNRRRSAHAISGS